MGKNRLHEAICRINGTDLEEEEEEILSEKEPHITFDTPVEDEDNPSK